MEQLFPDIRLNLSGYKKLYYHHKLKLPTLKRSLKYICHSYITGLEWILRYYLQGIPDWNWYYPWLYAPFLEDLVSNLETYKKPTFKLNQPLKSISAIIMRATTNKC